MQVFDYNNGGFNDLFPDGDFSSVLNDISLSSGKLDQNRLF